MVSLILAVMGAAGVLLMAATAALVWHLRRQPEFTSMPTDWWLDHEPQPTRATAGQAEATCICGGELTMCCGHYQHRTWGTPR